MFPQIFALRLVAANMRTQNTHANYDYCSCIILNQVHATHKICSGMMDLKKIPAEQSFQTARATTGTEDLFNKEVPNLLVPNRLLSFHVAYEMCF